MPSKEPMKTGHLSQGWLEGKRAEARDLVGRQGKVSNGETEMGRRSC